MFEFIEQKLDGNKKIAAFDADGTLWDTDVGEGFFEFEVQNNLFGIGESHWRHYKEIICNLDQDTNAGYTWLAQIHAGQEEKDVVKAAHAYFDSFKQFPYFVEIKKLLETFKQNNVEIYVVSASIRWALEPFVKSLGLNLKNLIAVETEVINGIITDHPVIPIPFKVGKANAIQQAVNSKLDFAFGNSMGDLAMLEACDYPTVITSTNQKSEILANSESSLQTIANFRDWPILKLNTK